MLNYKKNYGSCLKHEKVTFNHNTILNFYVVYEINLHHLI